MATIEEITQQVTDEVEENKPLYTGTSSGLVEFTAEEYAIHIESVANYRYEQQQFGYVVTRQENYKSIGEQLDQLFWSVDSGLFGDNAKTSQWYLDIKEVKDNNPKPS